MDSSDNDILVILEDDISNNTAAQSEGNNPWKVLIVDDEKDIHQVTRLAFGDFTFANKPLAFLSAYNSTEARDLLRNNPDTALILLDVVMETEDAGLRFIRFVREELKNLHVRIILRTGQPGQAPERKVIIDYDINDYKEKSELTANKFFATMVLALRSYQDIINLEKSRKTIEQIATASLRFVPQAFLRILNKNSIVELQLGDALAKEMSVLFLDVRSFTSLSEVLSLEENFTFINECLSFLEPAIVTGNGFIDKYMGDSIMALFDNSPADALNAAIAMLYKIAELNTLRLKRQQTAIKVGIGINHGQLMMGTVGNHNRMEVTVIGDIVNTAARIEQMAKLLGVSLLVSESILNNATDDILKHARKIPGIRLRGKQKSINIYEIFITDTAEQITAKLETKADFEAGMTEYLNNNIKTAIAHLEKVLNRNANDSVASYYLESVIQQGLKPAA